MHTHTQTQPPHTHTLTPTPQEELSKAIEADPPLPVADIIYLVKSRKAEQVGGWKLEGRAKLEAGGLTSAWV